MVTSIGYPIVTMARHPSKFKPNELPLLQVVIGDVKCSLCEPLYLSLGVINGEQSSVISSMYTRCKPTDNPISIVLRLAYAPEELSAVSKVTQFIFFIGFEF